MTEPERAMPGILTSVKGRPCEAICAAIESRDLTLVQANAREAVTDLLWTGELLQALEQGVALPSPQSQSFKDIASPTGALKGEASKASTRVIGLAVRNRDVQNVKLKGGEVAKAVLLRSPASSSTFPPAPPPSVTAPHSGVCWAVLIVQNEKWADVLELPV